ncbi:ferritin-like domain-containing protein [Phaeosphaeriaceae sp. PMI808]|nr:ferritin-like domain-containing protein [Phaeosphaeriaceae sp. PMI808]
MLLHIFAIISLSLATFARCAPFLDIGIAGGGLPNSPLPVEISVGGAKDVQLTQFLENLEVSFFSAASTNLSIWGNEGYSNNSLGTVNRIATQEEVHLETLTTILNTYNVPLIPPCNYSFPVSSAKEFFDVADLIGSVGISATIGLSQRLALSDPSVAKLISSILSVESRHDAFFRDVQEREPNPGTFDTGIDAIWAYNIALSFIVPGSCPVQLPIPVLPGLTVAQVTMSQVALASYANSTSNANSKSGDTFKEFTWDPTQMPFVVQGDKQLLAGWVNQANKPVYTPLANISRGKGTAKMPKGLSDVDDLARGTIAGPAVVVVS